MNCHRAYDRFCCGLLWVLGYLTALFILLAH